MKLQNSSANFSHNTVITSIKVFWFVRLLLEAHTRHSPIAVPSCVVTVTEYALEAGPLALRKTLTDPLSSDTLYTTGSKSIVISTEMKKRQANRPRINLRSSNACLRISNELLVVSPHQRLLAHVIL